MYNKEDLKYIEEKVLEGVRERLLKEFNISTINHFLYNGFKDPFGSNWVEYNILKEQNLGYYTIEQLIDLYYKRIIESDYFKEMRNIQNNPELIEWWKKELAINSRVLLFSKLCNKYGRIKANEFINLYIDNKKDNIKYSRIYKHLNTYSIANLFKETEENLADVFFNILEAYITFDYKEEIKEKEKEDKKYKKANLAVATG